MFRTRLVVIGIALLLLIAFGALAAAGAANTANTRTEARAIPTPLPASGLVIPHQAGTMLTVEQVKTYITSHTFWIGPTTTGQPFTIQTLQLMTAEQAYQAEKVDSLGVSDSTMVYYVKAKDPFRPVGLHLAPGVKPPATVNWAYEVWDAHSGKILEEGL